MNLSDGALVLLYANFCIPLKIVMTNVHLISKINNNLY